MAFNTLEEWLGWLEHCHPKEIDLGLDRIREVADRLGLLNPSSRVITVAGTNGKGSCVTAIAALLRQAGLHVGVYTSPHLLHYRERIRVDDETAGESELCESFTRIYNACKEISLTYFEFGTLAALDIFQRRQVDVMVLEVGLGGRLDAVNLIDSDIAVITSIELDHQDWLGNDRESIGREKAGIMRSHKPVICADPAPPQSLIAVAQTLSADLYLINDAFDFTAEANHWTWKGRSDGSEVVLKGMPLPLLPLPSLAAAIQALALLKIDVQSMDSGRVLADLRLPGRFQHLVYRERNFILDVAHNPAATHYLARRLLDEPCDGRTLAIVAMMADKDRSNSLGNLTHIIESWFVADLSDLPRAATPAQLRQDLQQLSVTVKGSGKVEQCIAEAIELAQPEDRVVIFGSFYTVAAALPVLQGVDTKIGSNQ